MATVQIPYGAALERANRLGFRLCTRETDTGQLVWEWSHQEMGPRAQFVSERVALEWMADRIERFEEDRTRHAW